MERDPGFACHLHQAPWCTLQEKEFAAERAKLDDASPKQRLAAVKARKAGVVEASVFDQLDVNGEAALLGPCTGRWVLLMH